MSEAIVRIAARGDGVTASGRHAALAAPGDLLDADGGLTWGPNHQVPPCRHFPECGGCQLQHLSDAAYAGYCRDRIVGALGQQGLATEFRPTHVSPPRSRRRAALRALKLGKGVAIGFSTSGTHKIVDMRECHVLRPELFALVAPLRALLATLLPSKRTGDVQLTLTDQGVDVALTGVKAEGLAAAEALTQFCERNRLARLAIDEGYGLETRYEPEAVTISLSGVAVAFPPVAFLQATSDGEAALVAAVREAVGDSRAVIDLFAGLGTFALALPSASVAAEASRDTVLALTGAIRRTGRTLVADHRDLYRRPYAPAELQAFDAAVLDPPRAGAEEQVKALAASRVARIAYVSCNPSTFARDAATLVGGGYRLDWIQPVGQFRWSTHIELAAAFSR